MYTAKDIRNICLLGHGGDGKSALAESMLFLTKAIDRLGKRTDGNTTSDFDPEEIKRGYSISTAVLPVEYNKCKLNILDNPGYFAFSGEVAQSLRVADAGLICLTAKGGIAVGTEKGWDALAGAGLPAMFYISKLDEEHADFFQVYDALHDTYGQGVVPLTFPIVSGEKVLGLVDVVSGTATKPDGSKMELPGDAADHLELYQHALNEAVAETSEELMEKFFMEEPFTPEELNAGIRAAINSRSLFPVFCGCSMTGLGTLNLLDNLVKYAPNPLEGKPMPTAEGGEIALDQKGAPMLFVFKTLIDQYGKNSFFKVFSGDVTSDLTLTDTRTGSNEKLGRLFLPKGKKYLDATKICCGDIGVVSKLANVRTGDTLGAAGKVVALAPITYEEPCYTLAVYAKVKGQEDKIANGLTKLNEEDCSFTFGNSGETKEMIISRRGRHSPGCAVRQAEVQIQCGGRAPAR